MTEPVLQAAGLTVARRDGVPVIEQIDLELAPGEVLGLVGESGSGKTTLGLALLGHARRGLQITAGRVRVADVEVVGADSRRAKRFRGSVISYVPQDPSVGINPAMRVGALIGDVYKAHHGSANRDEAVMQALERVQLPTDATFRKRFPHQLSGGQQQRVAIAMALVSRPAVAVLDEPTTGLDVITQAGLLEQVARLREELGMAVVYVSHDLSIVSAISDRIAVMYAGRIVELGSAAATLDRPRHPYTRRLIESIPDPQRPRKLLGIPGTAATVGEWPPGCAFAPRCDQAEPACETALPALAPADTGRLVRCIRWQITPPAQERIPVLGRIPTEGTPLLAVRDLYASHQSGRHTVIAAQGVSFDVPERSCIALVGRSGSGKTTIARAIVGLHHPDSGVVALRGAPLAADAQRRSHEQQRAIQIVFQNPRESLNPRKRIIEEIARPVELLGGVSRTESRTRGAELMERVRLPQRLAERYPGELSGGELQRAAIARALAAGPAVVVCDEVTSALDVSVQAAVLDLLANLQQELALTLVFITHDLGVVASVADRALVLDEGQICEQGEARELIANPQAEATRLLVAAAPSVSERETIDPELIGTADL